MTDPADFDLTQTRNQASVIVSSASADAMSVQAGRRLSWLEGVLMDKLIELGELMASTLDALEYGQQRVREMRDLAETDRIDYLEAMDRLDRGD